MSRSVDMRKPLQDQTREDIQYALDRGLITGDDRQVAADFLAGIEPVQEEPEDDDDNEPEEYNPSEHNVGDVIEHCEADGVSGEEVARILEAEQDDKNRSTLVEALEEMLSPEGDED